MPWVKGQSGNANGRAKGRRVRITDRFLRDLEKVWRDTGEAALRAAAQDEPAQFAGLVSKLLPKETELNVRHDLSERFISAIRNAALPTSPSVTVLDMKAETVSDGANPLIALDTQRNKDTP